MIKRSLQTLMLLAVVGLGAQVGIGNQTPRGLLDINNGVAVADPQNVFSGIGADKGMVVPIVQDAAAVATPTEGTIVYDLTDHCLKIYTLDGGKLSFTSSDLRWTCISDDIEANNNVALPIGSIAVMGFTGSNVNFDYEYIDEDHQATGEEIRLLNADRTLNRSISIAVNPKGSDTFPITEGLTYYLEMRDSLGQLAIVAFTAPSASASTGSLSVTPQSTTATINFNYNDSANAASGEKIQIYTAGGVFLQEVLITAGQTTGQVSVSGLTAGVTYEARLVDSTGTKAAALFTTSAGVTKGPINADTGHDFVYRQKESTITNYSTCPGITRFASHSSIVFGVNNPGTYTWYANGVAQKVATTELTNNYQEGGTAGNMYYGSAISVNETDGAGNQPYIVAFPGVEGDDWCS